ncbi:crotonobetainyl-CoA:carnitine CoA-transferase CaiB-like acyl-CoA transferase [Streptosporangium album]|uniref:Crotonobetainyl-CoA:carnitine CoA-transferase CaiB-like acyl-CoA transferase n=1 Tax=Streptosporangium album TaxID=47479 RepID=A0A7W7WEJ8_9ACTN|nr:CoA transferase [Streptosporangium album]MBB4944206.1 crotonobetainyl-CoA:carnitine CoA-transferase CaiB-like acyl-CoA transferase [Streptosporangium album]
MTASLRRRPLDGVRVVTFAQLYQGPYATMLLAVRLSRALATRTYTQWQETFDRIGVPAGPVHRLDEVPHDPHVLARQAIRSLDGRPRRRYVRQPLRLSGYSAHDPAPAPRLGEHTASLLRELDTSPHPEEVTEP